MWRYMRLLPFLGFCDGSKANCKDVPESPVTPEVKDLSPEPDPNPEPDPLPMEPLEKGQKVDAVCRNVHCTPSSQSALSSFFSASAGEKKRKRKRVLKSKTFVDEEGCIVTEKAYESESCTDSEGDFRSKPSAARKPPAGAAKKEPKEEKRGAKRATKANKQASIMGFFQKK
uniref:DNA polymerase delta subunit 3-like n=1 Tax=Podarcis muralis TaxID=64176 RepID=UPI00109F64D0|nr:DNA polymerase delta subunit 3-like [Podarcis muralis]